VANQKHPSDRYNHSVILLAIAAGGGIGALLRHFANHVVHARFGYAFPLGIFLVNVVGCLAIGIVAGLIAAGRIHVGEAGRAFIVVGVLGGFTTFSSFGLDTFTLARGGQLSAAALNAFGQLFIGLAAVWAGYAVAHARL
jgi:fluoride exporter